MFPTSNPSLKKIARYPTLYYSIYGRDGTPTPLAYLSMAIGFSKEPQEFCLAIYDNILWG